MLPDPTVTPVLTIEEAAAILRISRSAAYNAASRGEIPVLRIGRSLRVPTAPLVAMVNSTEASGCDEQAPSERPALLDLLPLPTNTQEVE